jgi:hypothetical protein
MADYTVILFFPDHKRGDVWPGLTIGPIEVDGDTPAQTLARVRMQFRKGSEVYTFDSTNAADRNAAITISNATTWTGSIAETSSFLPSAGVWSWDMEFYRTGITDPWTLYRGTLLVHPDITRASA